MLNSDHNADDSDEKTNEWIEVTNETEEDFAVLLCRAEVSGRLYIHLCGDRDVLHDDETTTIDAGGYEYVDVIQHDSWSDIGDNEDD